VLIHVRVSHLDCYFFAFVFGTVYLTHRTRSYRNRVELLKDVLNVATIELFEVLSSCFERMGRSIFPQILKFDRKLRANDIPTVTQILESFDEYNT
jgi:hypothetical protein